MDKLVEFLFGGDEDSVKSSFDRILDRIGGQQHFEPENDETPEEEIQDTSDATAIDKQVGPYHIKGYTDPFDISTPKGRMRGFRRKLQIVKNNMMNNENSSLLEEVDNRELRMEVINFIKANPNPEDEDFHGLAEKLGMEPSELEDVAYALLTSFIAKGKSNEKDDIEYDPEQIKKGIEVEMEHTDCMLIAEKIAKDHLAEFPDYYDRLDKMEEEAKAELGED